MLQASTSSLRNTPLALAALGLLTCAIPEAHAFDNGGSDAVVSAAQGSRMDERNLKVSGVNGAAMTGGANESPESEPVTSRWVSSAELSGDVYRWSLTRGRLDLGVSFASPRSTINSPALTARNEAPATLEATIPSLSLGLRKGPTIDRTPPSAWAQRAIATRSGDSYVSKLGVEWKPAQAQVNFLREGLGFRLDGNDRMTVRLRKGVIGLYMHRKF
ncbi:MAG: hypothetical protein ABIV63_18625 [Caldimonas sp.]